MEFLFGNFVDKTVTCWGCDVFDRLFRVVSAAGAAIYEKMILFAAIGFGAWFAFYAIYSFWKNISGGEPDPMYQKYLKPVLLNSVVIFSLFGLGVMLPRFVTTVTLEPVARMTMIYTQSMMQTTDERVNERVPYSADAMPENGFYRGELRDDILQIMKTSTTLFQSMIHFGLVIMDSAFSWDAIFGVGNLFMHILVFLAGLFFVYSFFKLFIRFMFYFVDVIIALTMFAFLLPVAMVLYIFKNSESAEWVKKLGDNITGKNGIFKNAVNTIVSLGAVVITYIVITVIMVAFLDSPNLDMAAILNGELFSGDVDVPAAPTVGAIIVLVIVVQFLADKIQDVAKEILSAFDITESHEIGDQLGAGAEKLFDRGLSLSKNVAGTIYARATGKEYKWDNGEKKDEGKKEEKKG
ncbi:MAG: hypothetical protein LBR41_01500 [Rickettsiales bacterium]|nr:hypothetical protein [Rickettsiales bacterium]